MQLTDVDIAKGSQAFPELSHLLLIGLGLVAVLVLGGALLLDVEAKVLQQHDAAALGLVDNGLDVRADAVRREGDGLAQELLELGDNRLQAVLGVGAAIGATQVGHEHHGLGTIVDSVLDGRDGACDALVVGHLLLRIEGHVEVDLGMVGVVSVACAFPLAGSEFPALDPRALFIRVLLSYDSPGQ